MGGRGVHRGALLLRRLARASPAEHVRTIRSQAWQPKQNTSTSGCCRRRGCLGRSSRSSRWLATLGQQRAVGIPIPASAPLAGRVDSSVVPALIRGTRLSRHGACLDRRAGSHRHRGRPSVAAAPLWGVRTSGHARALCPCGSHAGGRITPGCTRRRRANLFIQPVVNRCSVWATPPLLSIAHNAGGSASFTPG